ncbi:MAG: hypothetical protein LLF76_06350, partial [Planctomycetaceae bacterium]|nr:hypothetical protein [Planctomycetaceae bacterium]
MVLALLWLPALWAALSQDPNQFTILVIDRWLVCLPTVSILVLLIVVSRRYHMRVVFYLSSVLLVLIFVFLAIANISVWSSISIENKTPVSLYAVSVNLKDNRTRWVNISPQQTRVAALAVGEDVEFAKGYGHHVFVYDSKGSVYYDNTLLPEELERRHLITIDNVSVEQV